MYKKQMTLQRIVCLFLIIASALVFIYSLGLVTDLYRGGFRAFAENYESPVVKGTQIYYDIQGFNKALTTAGLILILLAVSQYVFQNNTRRKYYIANYITVTANLAAAVYYSVWGMTNIAAFKEQFLQIDFETFAFVAPFYNAIYTESTFWFDISTYVFGILLVANALNVLNMIWKVVLMNAEKKLIKAGKEGVAA